MDDILGVYVEVRLFSPVNRAPRLWQFSVNTDIHGHKQNWFFIISVWVVFDKILSSGDFSL